MAQSDTQPPTPSQLQHVLPTRLHLEGGLPPFKTACEFTLEVNLEAPPFLRMECVDQNLAYVLVDPFAIMADYQPQFSDSHWEAVGLRADDKPLLLAIVNFSQGLPQATVNLAAPLLINPATGKGMQVVLENAVQYSVRHRLLKDE